jgi:regulator of protease activity HflC (stomatin/prohibitin superfamily)
MCIPCFFTISTAEVGVVEKWGKFSRLVQPGLNCVICPMEQVRLIHIPCFSCLSHPRSCLEITFILSYHHHHPHSLYLTQLVGRMSFRVQQLDVRVETKTLDNVFLTAVVSVQYQILREKAYEAFYALTNPAQQITAHVYDVMRAQLPTLELDAVFEAKEDLALAVKVRRVVHSIQSLHQKLLLTVVVLVAFPCLVSCEECFEPNHE